MRRLEFSLICTETEFYYDRSVGDRKSKSKSKCCSPASGLKREIRFAASRFFQFFPESLFRRLFKYQRRFLIRPNDIRKNSGATRGGVLLFRKFRNIASTLRHALFLFSPSFFLPFFLLSRTLALIEMHFRPGHEISGEHIREPICKNWNREFLQIRLFFQCLHSRPCGLQNVSPRKYTRFFETDSCCCYWSNFLCELPRICTTQYDSSFQFFQANNELQFVTFREM